MKNANRQLQHFQQLGAPERPAVLQDGVVLLLNPDPGQLPQHVQLVRQVLKLDQLYLPRPPLLLGDGL